MSSLTSSTTDPQPPVSNTKLVAAGSIGNALEWYDFAIYGYLAPYIASQFFPSDDPLSSLLAAFGAFAAGYLARPLGAIIFGQIGDTIGRKHLLTISITMMGLSSMCIGLLPTYDQIGPAAGVVLVIFRVMQGISVGGEFTGSMVFLTENAPRGRRGLLASTVNIGCIAGFLLGSGFTALLGNLVSDDQLSDGTWRIAFLSGAIIMIIGLVLRRSLTVPDAVDRTKSGVPPVVLAIHSHWRKILTVACLALSANVGFYILFVFAVSYLTDEMHVSTARAMDINTAALFLMMCVVPIGGWISDIFGRKPVLIVFNFALFISAYPLFWLMHHNQDYMILMGQVGFALIAGIIFGTNPATLPEFSPKEARVSVLALGYNLAMALFGGTAPAVATLLIERTSNDMSPAFYMMLFPLLAVLVLLKLKEPANRDLT
ncbi:MAG: MFS transporter [Pseudomonadota bacterium]